MGFLDALWDIFRDTRRTQEENQEQLRQLVDENAFLAQQLEEDLRLFMQKHGFSEDDVYLPAQGGNEAMTFGDCLGACSWWRSEMKPMAQDLLDRPASELPVQETNNVIARLRNNVLHLRAARNRLDRVKEAIESGQDPSSAVNAEGVPRST